MPLFKNRRQAGSGEGSVNEMNPGHSGASMYLKRFSLIRHADAATGYLQKGNEAVNDRIVGQLKEAHEAGNDRMFNKHATALAGLHAEALRSSGFSHGTDGAKEHLEATAKHVTEFSRMNSTNANNEHLSDVRSEFAAKNSGGFGESNPAPAEKRGLFGRKKAAPEAEPFVGI
jgi:hypothetical protein